jgi:small subunit ribosomal protein S21
MVKVRIREKNKMDFGIRLFKKNTLKEGIVKEAKLRAEFEKPSEKKKRKRIESKARNKLNRRRGHI